MNLRKKIRDFVTLTGKSDGGFTLVELMVVIAIMAILGGVSVAGYSTYVKKTNMQADRTLAAEVARALQTHYYTSYDGTDTSKGGYVVLNYGEAARADGDDNYARAALEDTYGENWAEIAQLKYDGWEFNTDAFYAMAKPYASAIPDSSYISKIGTEKLLGDIQNCASIFAEFLSKLPGRDWTGKDSAIALNGLLGGTIGEVPEILNDYDDDEITEDVLANATVFGVASTLKNEDNATNTVNNFSSGYYLNRFTNNAVNKDNTHVLADVAHTYAALEAFVGYSGDSNVTQEFDKLNNDIKTATTVDAVVNAINEHGKKISKYGKMQEDEKTNLDNYIKSGMAETDGKAYVAMMKTVDDLGNDYKDDLSNKDLFADADIAKRVDSFVDSVGSSNGVDLSSFPEELEGKIGEHSVVVAVNVDEYGTPVHAILFCND